MRRPAGVDVDRGGQCDRPPHVGADGVRAGAGAGELPAGAGRDGGREPEAATRGPQSQQVRV